MLRHIDASHDFEISVNHPEYSPKVIDKSDVLMAPLVGGVLRLTVPVRD
jgi:hypothetical protein